MFQGVLYIDSAGPVLRGKIYVLSQGNALSVMSAPGAIEMETNLQKTLYTT